MAGGYTRMAHRDSILNENNGDELEKSLNKARRRSLLDQNQRVTLTFILTLEF
jgi:hypothetical protein